MPLKLLCFVLALKVWCVDTQPDQIHAMVDRSPVLQTCFYLSALFLSSPAPVDVWVSSPEHGRILLCVSLPAQHALLSTAADAVYTDLATTEMDNTPTQNPPTTYVFSCFLRHVVLSSLAVNGGIYPCISV